MQSRWNSGNYQNYPNQNIGAIIGVLTPLSDTVANRLAMGRSVDLLDLCIISPKVSSESVENEADFNAGSYMRKVGVNIRVKKI